MPWTMNDYPSSMKNLDRVVRKKAIEIANAMTKEGYDESRVIPIATQQAEEWYDHADQDEIESFAKQGKPTQVDGGSQQRPEMLEKGEHVVPHDEGWAVKSQDGKKPSAVYETKKEAQQHGRDVAKNKGTSLTIHRQDGTIEERFSYEGKQN